MKKKATLPSSTLLIDKNKSEDDDDNDQQSLQTQKKQLQKQQKQISKYQQRKRQRPTLGYQNIIAPFIFFHIGERQYFHINGDFFICIQESDSNEQCILKKMSTLTHYDRYITSNNHPTEFLKDFELPIKLLENTQNLEKYNFAQQLRLYQPISSITIEYINQIFHSYQDNLQELNELNQKRSFYKKQLIDQYINEQLKEDDFFTVAELGINFEYLQSEIKNISMSRGLFALIGVEDKDISQYLLHIGMIDTIFLSQTEKFFGTLLEILEQNKFNQKLRKKDFIINTLDDLKLYYEAEFQVQKVEYPEELQYKCKNQLQACLDYIIILKYDISYYHLKQILIQRQSKKQVLDNEFISANSLEYSFLSQIFLEKYYPNYISSSQNQQKEFDKQQQQIKSKLCNYRSIS